MILLPAIDAPPLVLPGGATERAAKDSTRSSLSGTLPFFHSHWVMSCSSFEPPPVKMLAGDWSTVKTDIALAWLVVQVPSWTPSPLVSHGMAASQPRSPSVVHV